VYFILGVRALAPSTYEKDFSGGGDRRNGIEEIEAARNKAQKRMYKAIEKAFGLEWKD